MSGVGGAVCEEEKTSSECLELGKGSKGANSAAKLQSESDLAQGKSGEET